MVGVLSAMFRRVSLPSWHPTYRVCLSGDRHRDWGLASNVNFEIYSSS